MCGRCDGPHLGQQKGVLPDKPMRDLLTAHSNVPVSGTRAAIDLIVADIPIDYIKNNHEISNE